jgi:two-component system response regulator AtoC
MARTPDASTRKLQHGETGARFLVVFAPAQVPARHLLGLGKLVIGRAATCDIVIDHETISRQHAALHVTADGVTVEDLGSANGTSVGGIALETGSRAPVPLGAMIAFGEVIALLRTGPNEDKAAPSSRPDEIERVAATHLPVLIMGETGVGKEVVAETLVAKSPRRKAPFVRINCAALTESLFESELFGHERGAFTSADRAKPGLLETADGGTVLLDEVGELPLAAQAKLLRVLESGEVTRVGAVASKRVDVRFLAATNRDLAAMVDMGTFRADLLYRLDGITVRVAPLRERTSEIPTLARQLLESACKVSGRKAPLLGDEAIDRLVRHDWPGNVRELRRVMERVAALVPGAVIAQSDLEPLLVSAMARVSRPPPPPSSTGSLRDEVKSEVESIERTRIEDALRRAAGNQTQAAKLLGISRRTLIDRIDRFGLPRPRRGS